MGQPSDLNIYSSSHVLPSRHPSAPADPPESMQERQDCIPPIIRSSRSCTSRRRGRSAESVPVPGLVAQPSRSPISQHPPRTLGSRHHTLFLSVANKIAACSFSHFCYCSLPNHLPLIPTPDLPSRLANNIHHGNSSPLRILL